ncbi:MAG: hypothetical protein N3F65_00120 [Nitrososphaeria archaeon]|nr:hypothetical protein [Aigarchaeota archaeon]MCX8187006.1 hypothetical protein [Nitrososphaeria archaeon]MDW8021338.1 hypothetical protein [Nitrososphaerota archaeon]
MRVSTGLPKLDDELGGGVKTGAITLIYGEEKSGKTSLALKICASAARIASAAYIDCLGKLHPLRLSQIVESNRVDGEKIYLLSVENFLQQEEVILKILDEHPPAPLVVFDDFTYLHRMELSGDVKSDINIYKRLAFQIAVLKEAALRDDVAIVLIGQVHGVPDKGEARAVAHRILTHWSDYVLRVERAHGQPLSRIILEKPEGGQEVYFRITRSGVTPG